VNLNELICPPVFLLSCLLSGAAKWLGIRGVWEVEAGALPSMGMGWVGNRPIPVGRPMEEEGPLLGNYEDL